MEKNNLSIPAAIIIAGAMVACSIYFVNSDKKSTTPTDEIVTEYAINMPVVNNDDHVRGNPAAPIKIVEYSDTECPFCKNFHNTMKDITNNHGKDGTVAWVYRHFPIKSLHAKAIREAEATECVASLAGEDAFWSYLDRIYATTGSNDRLPDEALFTLAAQVGVERSLLNTCLETGQFTKKISDSVEEAQKAGARGTPYSVIELSEELTSDQALALRTLNEQITGGTETVIRADEVTKDKISVYGAMPLEIMNAIIEILKN